MAVENANYVNQLNTQLPQPKDLVKEGDDHIRLVKKVLKNCFPSIDKKVDATADWLNGVFARIKFGAGTVSFENNALKNVAAGTQGTDGVNLNQVNTMITAVLRDKVYRVGSLYTTTENVNPNTILGFGTWQPYATGRALCGVGRSTDGRNEPFDVGNMGAGGLRNIYIDKGHLPAITLAVGGQTDDQGNHQHDSSWGENEHTARGPFGESGRRGAGSNKTDWDNNGWLTSWAGQHRHNINARTEQLGNRSPHDNCMPWQGAFIWRRTA